MRIIREVVGGMGAALAAYIINRLFLKITREQAIVYLVPLTEELVKTTAAILLGGWLPGVHFVFGIIEAIYDFFHGRIKGMACLAAVMSMISHGIFGIITHYFYLWTHSLVAAILVATVIHGTWNYFATRP